MTWWRTKNVIKRHMLKRPLKRLFKWKKNLNAFKIENVLYILGHILIEDV